MMPGSGLHMELDQLKDEARPSFMPLATLEWSLFLLVESWMCTLVALLQYYTQVYKFLTNLCNVAWRCCRYLDYPRCWVGFQPMLTEKRHTSTWIGKFQMTSSLIYTASWWLMESGVLVVLKAVVHRLHQMGLVLLWTGAPKRLSIVLVIWSRSKMKKPRSRSVLLTDWIGRKVSLRELWNLRIIICNILELFVKYLQVKLWVSWREGEFWELMHRWASVFRRLKLACQKRAL